MANTTGKKFGGRQKGSLNKQTKEMQALMFGPKGPFKTLLNKMNSKKSTEAEKIDCAKALLKFTNSPMPVQIEADVSASMTVTLIPGDEDV